MLIEIFDTFLKSLVSFAVLFILARIMGKKQLSQLSFFDYVVGISIGSIAAEFAVDPTINYLRGFTSLIVYALFPLFMSFLSIKSYRARKLLDGKPTVLIQNGRMIEKNIKYAKMTVNDVLEECRLKNAFNIAEIEFAVLETNGNVSVQMKSENQPLTPKDMNIRTEYKGLCINVIVDGKILHDHLSVIGKDEKWVFDELGKQNIQNHNDILLGYVDSNSQLVVQEKNNREQINPLV